MINTKITALPGVDQSERLPLALEEGYFNVDEMTFEDLISASVEFAGELKFYNSNYQVSGDWREFLAANEIVIMALIINKDTNSLRDRFRYARNSSPITLINMLGELVAELDKWLADLARSSSEPARSLVTRIENTVEASLLNELLVIELLAERMRERNIELPIIDRTALGSSWRKRDSSGLSQQQQSRPAQITSEEQVCVHLRRAAYEFINAFEHLKSECRSLLPLSLKTQSHDPAVSLFITFLKLFRYAQDKANDFTQRHLDFYYQDILKTELRPRRLEAVVLDFSIATGGEPVFIGEGQKFLCGKDENLRDIVFSTTQDLTVTDIEVAALYTLRFDREPMITPECDMHFVTRINKQSIPQPQSEAPVSQQTGWSLFGDVTGAREQGCEGLADLQIGLAVTSKVLFLEEGDRRIELEIGLVRSVKPVSSYMEALENARSRTEFIQGLHAMLLGWLSSEEHQNWELAVPGEFVDNVRENAIALDARFPPVIQSYAREHDEQLESCAGMLLQTIAAIKNNRDKSLPYLNQLRYAENEQEFREGLGALVIHFLLEGGDLSGLFTGGVDSRARVLGCEKSLDSIKRELGVGRERLLKKYFGTAFVLHLSTASGWLRIDRYDVLYTGNEEIGLKLVLGLTADAPAVTGCVGDIHGNQWDTDLPILKLTINPEASLNVYSLLEPFCLDRVTINAGVTGARNIVAYNNISQLDPSKPFYPFGPTPTTSSYLALASPEAAKKLVSEFTIHLHWGDLPSGEEGFDGHYEGYSSKFRNSSFTARVNVLSNGSWQPQSSAQIQTAPLFVARGKKLQEHQVIKVQSAEYLRPVELDTTETELDLGLRTRNGFIKLTLASPEAGFGHQEFPLKLSETLESNAKKRRVTKKNKLPRSPYTPLLNKLSVDYKATAILNINSTSSSDNIRHPDKLFRLHAFGAERVSPNGGNRSVRFFKPFDQDGNLLIALSGSRLQGTTTLYFSLSDDSRRSRSGNSAILDWSYLGHTGWIALSAERIIVDETKGFLCSGIVILDLPSDLVKGRSDMQGNHFWLKIATDSPSASFSSLRSIRTHAVALERSAEDGASFDAQGSEDSLRWQPRKSIPGLARISQPDAFFDIGKQESRRQLNTRMSERLRHRSRAVTSWDYERLVLERFPMVGKVLCLPNRSTARSVDSPGSLLLVVTPRIQNPQAVVGKTPRLSAVHLNDIKDYVAGLGSPFATIEVTNPSYEWVQVRCAVVLEKFAAGGLFTEQLNEDIGRYLNPWDNTGYGLKFCQPVKREDLYSYIYNLNYVRYVTDFSMLHINRNEAGYYYLGDSVKNEIIDGEAPDIIPNLQWSLIVPLQRHHIEIIREVQPKAPDITGIRDLEVGSTFIIGEQ